MNPTVPTALRLEILEGNIALVTLDQPGSRANTLGQAVLAEFEAMARQLANRTDLQGLILRSGKPGMFIAGADLKELGGARPDPNLTRQLVQRGLGIVAAYENLPFPTMACIDGACAGGGLELVLGFDYRLASSNSRTELGLPEVKIGLIPGWGGTQRLTRLIGPSLAAELICAGELANTTKARQYGIVFDVVPVDRLVEEARGLLAWARSSGDWEKGRQRKRQPVGLSEEQLSFASAAARGAVLAKAGPHYPAPAAALDAIFKGCNLPLDEGLKLETEQFAPLVGSTVSRNLIAIFFMTQRLQKDPGVADLAVKARDIRQAGVIGAGIMGAGIAAAHVRRGIPTLLLDSIPAALERGVTNLTTSLAGRVEAGRMSAADMAGALARLSTSLTLAALGDRDLVVEAIVEDEATKVKLFGTIQGLLPPDAILASNTSTISISRMARAVAQPERFAGLHFFNPVDRMQLVEVIRGERTGEATIATLVAHVKRIGKTPVVVRDCPGFLVNRILFPYMNEAIALLEEGVSPRDVDKAATAFGMPMGPITLQDVVGLDTSFNAGKVIAAAFPDRGVSTSLIAELVQAGRLGQKSGSGFYAYPKGPKGVDDPALNAVLAKVRKAPRVVSPEEITDRLFLPMLTEASRVLTEGVVREPADVDMGLILGIGFPAFRGGLLRWADSEGLPKLVARLEKCAALGKRFEPTEQLRQLAAQGKGFYGEG
jgi:3-hydroxyacyl-CoA dehydrogenase/enoyl-CoA hydratase/3-hydroxybutyryl-CoA epimerase/enoyl-CoA isomerase